MGTSMVWKQVLREFWLPFVVAVVWASYRVYTKMDGGILDFIANFGASFFLASWAASQVMRIRKQRAVELSFEKVENHFAELNKTMASMLETTNQIRELAQHVPGLEPKLEALSKLVKTASYQLTEADVMLDKALRADLRERMLDELRWTRKRMTTPGMSPPPPP